MTKRSYEPITDEHLARLGAIAAKDRQRFEQTRPEYRRRHLATVLAPGAALHFVNGTDGVKDLNVWSFYSLIPGSRWPADRRNVSADFGPSSLGRQKYNLRAAPNERARRAMEKAAQYEGRRVDLLMRALPVGPKAEPGAAILDWLTKGQQRGHGSAWFLSNKTVVLIDPESRRGEVLWPE
jgi:hypothetical protein